MPAEEPERTPEAEPETEEALPVDEVSGVEALEDNEPAIVATETMAELYLSQGHRQEALEVYRILWRETPDDQRLKEKVEALESELEEATQADAAADAVAESAWDEVTVSDEAEQAMDYEASKTGGQRTRAFFKGLLAARPGSTKESSDEAETADAAGLEDQPGEVVGEPTRPAQDRLSLSAVFGEDTSPVPPAVAGADAAEGEQSVDGFSFDSFFGGERGDPSRRRSTSPQARSQEDDADLDQFHAWLQGLKG
jgi:hypothetical protein